MKTSEHDWNRLPSKVKCHRIRFHHTTLLSLGCSWTWTGKLNWFLFSCDARITPPRSLARPNNLVCRRITDWRQIAKKKEKEKRCVWVTAAENLSPLLFLGEEFYQKNVWGGQVDTFEAFWSGNRKLIFMVWQRIDETRSVSVFCLPNSLAHYHSLALVRTVFADTHMRRIPRLTRSGSMTSRLQPGRSLPMREQKFSLEKRFKLKDHTHVGKIEWENRTARQSSVI